MAEDLYQFFVDVQGSGLVAFADDTEVLIVKICGTAWSSPSHSSARFDGVPFS
jgi:membrane-bound lytic murein transglycosylase